MRNTPTFKLLLRLASLLLMITVAAEALAAQKGDGLIEPGEDEIAKLARAAQNPVASMISLPFQSNTDFNFGPLDKTQSVLNIQPVIPFDLNDNWNLITRTIVPIVSMPGVVPGQERETGIGDTVFTAFYHRRNPENGYGAPVPLRLFRLARAPDWDRMSGVSAHQ